MATIASASRESSPGELVSLFRLDTSFLGGPVMFFCQAALDGEGISFGGQIYTPVDVEFTGFEVTGVGSLPRPMMRLKNTTGVWQNIINTFGDLVGCSLHRVRTFRRFLDGESDADPGQYYGPDAFRIERRSAENKVFIEWELSAAIDEADKMLPGRVVIRDTCAWRYRVWNPATNSFDYSKTQCPYTGTAYFNALGQSEAQPSKDDCGRRLSDCQKRFGKKNPLPFGGFPGAGRIRA